MIQHKNDSNPPKIPDFLINIFKNPFNMPNFSNFKSEINQD